MAWLLISLALALAWLVVGAGWLLLGRRTERYPDDVPDSAIPVTWQGKTS